MDPDANLEEQLRIAEDVLNGDGPSADWSRLAELVVALDEWIKKGGFLPKAWAKRYARPEHMSDLDQMAFESFCDGASDDQIKFIRSEERGRANREEAKGDGSTYYATCARIAEEECGRRGF